jgi:calmodulin
VVACIATLGAQAKGGVLISEAEIEAAFRFFDTEGKGSINMKDLKKRLQPFYKDMPAAEYKFLLGDAKSISLHELKELLEDNDVAGFDPVAEAFKVYDPSGSGFVQIAVLRDVFRRLGFDDLSDEDMNVLVSGLLLVGGCSASP